MVDLAEGAQKDEDKGQAEGGVGEPSSPYWGEVEEEEASSAQR